MAISLHTWTNNAHIDYMAGRQLGAHIRPVPVLLISPPGEGKSQMVEVKLPAVLESHLFPNEAIDLDALPAELREGHIHFSPNGMVAVITDMPPTRDAPDYRGFMVPKKDGTSAYTMNDIIKTERALYAAGVQLVVLFLDELLQADHLTQKVLTDGLLNGRYGPYSLDKRTWTIAASNRQKDGAGVNRALTILTNRVNMVEAYMPIDDWISYATDVLRLPPLCVTFAQTFPGKISVDQPPREGAFPTKRSFTYASQWLAQYKLALGDTDEMSLPFSADGDGDYVFQKVAGFIGEGLALELSKFAAVRNELPSIEEILHNPDGAKLPPTSRMDACYAAAQMVIHYADGDNMDQLWQYAMRLPEELQVATAKRMLASQGSGMLHNSAALGGWIKTHASLIRSTTAL